MVSRRIFVSVLTVFINVSTLLAQVSVEEGWRYLDTLLSKNISEKSELKYLNIKVTDDRFITYSQAIASADLRRFNGNRLLAHLVNAYNFGAIKNVANNYPVQSIVDIPGFYDQNKIFLSKEKFTLNKLLNELILRQFNDPRILFLLSDGTYETLPYESTAVRPYQIEYQLENRTKKAINDTNFVKVDTLSNQLILAPIFDTYKELFTKDGELLLFINKYKDQPVTYGFDIVYRKPRLGLRDGTTGINESHIINLQQFTPATTLGKKRWEFSSTLDFYTQTSEFDFIFRLTTERETQLNWVNHFDYGLLDNLNIGLELQATNKLSGGPRAQNPLFVVLSPNDKGFRSVLSYVGARAEWRPIPSYKSLSVFTKFRLPVARDLEANDDTFERSNFFIDWNRSIWEKYVRWDIEITPRMKLLSELGLWTSFPSSSSSSSRTNTYFESPLTETLVFFPNGKVSIYGLVQLWGFHTNDRLVSGRNFNQFDFFNQYLFLAGFGSALQIVPSKWELDLKVVGRPIGSDGLGAGNSIKVGLRRIGLF